VYLNMDEAPLRRRGCELKMARTEPSEESWAWERAPILRAIEPSRGFEVIRRELEKRLGEDFVMGPE
jgi:hypothetical protein